jgi:hypothetical protein
MPAQVSLDVDAKEALALIERGIRATDEASFALFMTTDVREYLQDRVRQRFADEGDDAVGAWLPLDPDTVAIKEKQGRSRGTNIRTGALFEWLTEAEGRLFGAEEQVILEWPSDPPSAEVLEHFLTAQEGSEETGAPARPVLGFSTVDFWSIMNDLNEFLVIRLSVGGDLA